MKCFLSLVAKFSVFYIIINFIGLPLVMPAGWDLRVSYYLALLAEGACTFLVGGYMLFTTLFSTIEVEDDRYVGDRFLRHKLKTLGMTGSRKRDLRRKGGALIITAFVLAITSFIVVCILSF